MHSGGTESASGGEPAIEGVLCNARLRHRPREGAEPVVELGENGLRRFAWVGGRLWVDDQGLRFIGSEMWSFVDDDMDDIPYSAVVDAGVIESVAKRRGVVGVPYVAVTTTDGAQLQVRAGAVGKHSDRVVQAVEASMAATPG